MLANILEANIYRSPPVDFNCVCAVTTHSSFVQSQHVDLLDRIFYFQELPYEQNFVTHILKNLYQVLETCLSILSMGPFKVVCQRESHKD
jgi:hypothetical protein